MLISTETIRESKKVTQKLNSEIEVTDKTNEQLICDVCGSDDIAEVPQMGTNCNQCHPIN